MKKTKLTRSLLAACSIVALSAVMYGCTGDGAENDLKGTQGDLESVQAELDAAKAKITELEGQVSGLQGDLDTANGNVTRLTGELGTANGEVTRLTGELGTANAEVTRLMGELGTANADVTRLTGELNAANGEVTRLTGELGTANGEVTRLTGELGTANGNVTRLEGELETANGEIERLEGELETANARIMALEEGTADDVLMPIKEAASDAADAAGEASTAAGEAADAADEAAMNQATIQTGMANSVADAADARMYANMAADEAENADNASQMAQDAMNAGDATPHRLAAETAQEAAEEAQGMAEDAQGEAEADAMAELKIDGTMKSVGDVTIDATAPNNVITTGTGATAKTVDTGFQAMLQQTDVGALTGQPFAAGTPPAADTPYRQAVAARDIDIGKTVDSADDMARLAIVTSYAGSKTVKVFSYAEADPDVNITTDGRTGTAMGKITLDDGDAETTDTNNTSLRSLGMYYLAGDAADTDGLSEADVVGDEAEGMAVYSYVADQNDDDPANDVTVYLVMDSQRTDGGTTTYVYRSVDIIVDASRADGPDDDTTADAGQVTATIPEATDYDHIHFGVWAGLSGDGANMIAGHGIGFVQSIGDGMTADDDMPNFGDATYNGNWAATVQAADPDGNGAVTRQYTVRGWVGPEDE